MNKHLLPVYDKPMIYYPLQMLIDAGITDVMIVSSQGHAGNFLELLGSGTEFGIHLTYEIQDEAGGIAQALGLAEDFANDEPVTVILGDNIFQDNVKNAVSSFRSGAMVFLKEVPDAKRFGVAQVKENSIISIKEKPAVSMSNLAVTGLYIYDHMVFSIIKTLVPSKRGELEITDVNNEYIRMGKMNYSILSGYWSDAGTFESLFRASELIKKMKLNSF
jgi:glucose-1-phosphate thymidylyltransferase